MNSATNKGTVKVTIITLDKGDDTIIFRKNEATGDMFVKLPGEKSRKTSLEEATPWIANLILAKWGDTTETKMMPEWALSP
jgi:hypothetical protein